MAHGKTGHGTTTTVPAWAETASFGGVGIFPITNTKNVSDTTGGANLNSSKLSTAGKATSIGKA